jgi:hypothetical protein
MSIVFILAHDWTLRAGLRAQLREQGIEALGMESNDDAGKALAAGQLPSVLVLEATADLSEEAAIQSLAGRVPTILIASRTETVELPPVAAVLYRPVTIGQIAEEVQKIVRGGHLA